MWEGRKEEVEEGGGFDPGIHSECSEEPCEEIMK